MSEEKKTCKILAIESSCDETAAAVIEDGRTVRSNIISSQIALHTVGVAEAKAIAYAAGLPLVGVHHIEGHVSANYIEHPDLEPPFLCEIISGGHTHLVIVKDYGVFEILGRTRDDAAGEAFDKVARAIGLGYPGGPKIDRLAKEGNPHAIEFPRAHIEEAPYDFSFSGLKSGGDRCSGGQCDPGGEGSSYGPSGDRRRRCVQPWTARGDGRGMPERGY